jgi:hypothetical protein
VDQQKDFLTLKQSGYAKKVLSRFGMEDCNPTKVPMDPGTKLHEDKKGQRVDATKYRRIIGCLRYLIHTRPDLAFLVGVASRYMEKPTVMHMQAVKKIIIYLKGSVDLGLVYTLGEDQEEIVDYFDSDMGADLGGGEAQHEWHFISMKVSSLGVHKSRRQLLSLHVKPSSWQPQELQHRPYGSEVCTLNLLQLRHWLCPCMWTTTQQLN